jgi:WD40 repeat protein
MTLCNQRAVTGFLLGASALTGVLVSGNCPAHAWQTENAATSGKPKPVTTNPEIIRDLIEKIGDDSFDIREAAHKRLEAIGGDALELLRDATLKSTDAEVRKRAGQLARSIEKTLLFEVRRFERHVRGVFPLPWATRVVVTPDGRKAVSSGCDGLRSWDLATGKQDLFFGEIKQGGYWALGLSVDGKQVIAGGSDKIVRLLDLQTGKQIQQFIGHKAEVWGAALSPDGKRAVTGALDQLLCIWNVESGKQIAAFAGVRDNVRCLALSADGQLLAVGHTAKANEPGTVRLWDVPAGKEVRVFAGHTLEVSSVGFSPDGKYLLTSSFDKTLRLWDVASGEERKRFVGHTSRVEYAAFTPDGKRIVSCGDQDNPTVRLWEVASGKQLFESESVDAGFLSVAVLPDGRQCVTAGKDGIVRLWRWAR